MNNKICLLFIILILLPLQTTHGEIKNEEIIEVEEIFYCYEFEDKPQFVLGRQMNNSANVSITYNRLIEYWDFDNSKTFNGDAIQKAETLSDVAYNISSKPSSSNIGNIRQFELNGPPYVNLTKFDVGEGFGFVGFNLNVTNWSFNNPNNRLALEVVISTELEWIDIVAQYSNNTSYTGVDTSSNNSLVINYNDIGYSLVFWNPSSYSAYNGSTIADKDLYVTATGSSTEVKVYYNFASDTSIYLDPRISFFKWFFFGSPLNVGPQFDDEHDDLVTCDEAETETTTEPETTTTDPETTTTDTETTESEETTLNTDVGVESLSWIGFSIGLLIVKYTRSRRLNSRKYRVSR